jgi:hypothetical protein
VAILVKASFLSMGQHLLRLNRQNGLNYLVGADKFSRIYVKNRAGEISSHLKNLISYRLHDEKKRKI